MEENQLSGQLVLTFKYNQDSIRTSNTSQGVEHKYTLNGSQILAEEWGAHLAIYLYDESGSPIGMQYRNTTYAADVFDTYYFEKNLQGDIIAVYTDAGRKIGSYTYDAWGNVTVSYASGATMAEKRIVRNFNPFRYRGYYYDIETGLYYLQSRYYDPVMGRFLNVDNIRFLGASSDFSSLNLYTYCGNNPISRSDPEGGFWITLGIMGIGAVVGAVVSAITSAITQYALEGSVNWKSVSVSAGTGFITGALAASPLGVVGQTIAGGIISGLSYAADCYVNDRSMKLDEAIVAIGFGVATGLYGGNGANYKMQLTNAFKSVKGTIAREARRANQDYAMKMVRLAIRSRNNTVSGEFWVTTFKYTVGVGASNELTAKYSSWGFYPNAPSWKPW